MSLRIFNTMTKKKEDFKPIKEGEVKMYVCGPTVYDFLHIGNFRGAIFFNLVRNWLEKKGNKVDYIYNYTDVDDKIINRAKEENCEASEISNKYIKEFEKDYAQLRLRPHTKNPRVSEHIDDIVQFIDNLIKKDKAYAVDGDVYYNVESFDDYGNLTNKKLDEMESGSRIEVDERKRHPSDFALWKSSKAEEPSWKSPWGDGRPGWHIECSAMTYALLGETIDIHGGGLDLTFPHHENEIAQSEGRTGKTYAHYWMHNNMLEFGSQKMSKSLGNVKTGRDFLEEYDGEILKYMMLSSHYRSTIDFSPEQIDRTIGSLAKFYSSLALAKTQINAEATLSPISDKFQKIIDEASKGIDQALDDDFNTPVMMSHFFEVLKAFNAQCRIPGKVTPIKKATAEVFYHWVRDKAEVTALFQEEPAEYLQVLDDMLLEKLGVTRSEVDSLVSERIEARDNKDYAKSDELRDKLKSMGIAIMDGVSGTSWEVEK